MYIFQWSNRGNFYDDGIARTFLVFKDGRRYFKYVRSEKRSDNTPVIWAKSATSEHVNKSFKLELIY